MDYKAYLNYSDSERRHTEAVLKNYRLFYTDPKRAAPAVLVRAPFETCGDVEEYVADPHKMMLTNLNRIRSHLDAGDDYAPAMRVEFGTGLMPSAYGCEVYVRKENLPCVSTHILRSAEEIPDLEMLGLTGGWLGKAADYAEYFMAHMPEGVSMQLPDLQGPFNIAYLLRGNDILLDFFEYPEEVKLLCDKCGEFLSLVTAHLNRLQRTEDGWFCDFGALWKGATGIRNCSVHMISTEFYKTFAREADVRLLRSLGGGRVHYCGQHDNGLLDSFFDMGEIMSGIDVDSAYHDLWEVSGRAPEKAVVFTQCMPSAIDRLLSGDWPEKRNIVVEAAAPTAEAARDLYKRLKASIPS